MEFAPPTSDTSNERDSAVWIYGFTSNMRYGGPEYLALPSIRYAHKGDREIVCCHAPDLWSVLPQGMKDTLDLSEDRNITVALGESLLNAKVGEAWVTELVCLDEGHKNKKIFFRGVIPEGSVFYMPGGMIFIEQVINGKPCVGFRVAIKDGSKSTKTNLEMLANLHSSYASKDSKLCQGWQACLQHGKKEQEGQ